MLSNLEQQLANVLGTRLLPPFRGRVAVADAPPAGAGPVVSIAVTGAGPLNSDLGNVRPETVPGAADPRRVLKLLCTLEIGVMASSTAGRVQQMLGIDAVMYEMDASDIRSGQALLPVGDAGFAIDQIVLSQVVAPLDPTVTGAPAVALNYSVEGWFWPIGTPGASGPTIDEMRLGATLMPLSFVPASPTAIAGGPAIDIAIIVAQTSSTAISAGGLQPAAIPNLALLLSGPGGKIGAGTLSNTQPGIGNIQIATLDNGVATVTYTPPALAAVDTLIVSTDDGTGSAGLEIGRVTIRVTS